MSNVISNEVKLNIAIAAIQNSELRIKDLAEQFNVSPTSVRRAKENFAEEALLKLEEMQNAQNAQNASLSDPFNNYKGYRPRNGRMSIIRSVIAELGVDANPKEFYDRVSVLSAENDLYPIKRAAVYVLMRQEIAKL